MAKKLIANRRAQVVIEYVLILFISVACATILTKALISRNPNDPGKMISAWNRILQVIGNDLPDCPTQSEFSKPRCN